MRIRHTSILIVAALALSLGFVGTTAAKTFKWAFQGVLSPSIPMA